MDILKVERKKMNNKGLTLVEVIVAVAILSFAILPLMYTFVYTTRFNAKSREQQRATSAAEALMENYKAYPLAEINSKFDSNTFTVGDSGAMGTDVIYYKDLSSTPSKYVIKNMNFEKSGADNTKYDALITVQTYNGDSAKYGGELYEMKKANPYNDAVYRGEELYDSDTYQKVKKVIQEKWNEKSKSSAYPDVFPENEIIFKRKLTITVTGSSGSYIVKPVLTYQYGTNVYYYKDPSNNSLQFDDFETLKQVGGGVDFDGDNKTFEEKSSIPDGKIYDSSLNGGTLERLLIYYYPLYEMTDTSHPWIDEDTIEIYDNRSDIASAGPLDVYLYKQASLGVDEDMLYTYEANTYNSGRTKVKIMTGNINLYHNLKCNLGTSATGEVLKDNGLNLTNVISTEGSAVCTDKTSVTPSPVPTADVLSEITVTIYPKGSIDASGNVSADARVLAQIQGSFNGK